MRQMLIPTILLAAAVAEPEPELVAAVAPTLVHSTVAESHLLVAVDVRYCGLV